MRMLATAFVLAMAAAPALADEILTARGLGLVRIGMRRAQVEKALGSRIKLDMDDPACTTAGAPGGKASFMFFHDRLVRIDADAVGVRTPEGAYVGMTEAALKKLYGKRARTSTHPYGAEPNDHYVAVKLPPRDRLLIFETRSRRVENFRIGTLQAAQLSEGCN